MDDGDELLENGLTRARARAASEARAAESRLQRARINARFGKIRKTPAWAASGTTALVVLLAGEAEALQMAAAVPAAAPPPQSQLPATAASKKKRRPPRPAKRAKDLQRGYGGGHAGKMHQLAAQKADEAKRAQWHAEDLRQRNEQLLLQLQHERQQHAAAQAQEQRQRERRAEEVAAGWEALERQRHEAARARHVQYSAQRVDSQQRVRDACLAPVSEAVCPARPAVPGVCMAESALGTLREVLGPGMSRVREDWQVGLRRAANDADGGGWSRLEGARLVVHVSAQAQERDGTRHEVRYARTFP